MKVLGWAVIILFCFALVSILATIDSKITPTESVENQATGNSGTAPTKDPVITPTERSEKTKSSSPKPESNPPLRTDDREKTAQLTKEHVEKKPAENDSQRDLSMFDIPEQDVNLALGAVKIINSDNVQWVACPSVDEMHYLTNLYEKLRTTHKRDDAQALFDNALSHFKEKNCIRVIQNHVLVFTDTPSQTSTYLDSNVSFIQVTVYLITDDDGGTKNRGNHWVVQEFVANSQISSPVKVRRTQSTQKDTPTPRQSAAKKPGKIITVTGDYLIVCSDLPGIRSITSIDLSDYPEETIPQILDNTRCNFLYPGDQLRLNPDAPTEGDFVRLPIIEGDADEYEMWTSTGFLMVYTDVIGVR